MRYNAEDAVSRRMLAYGILGSLWNRGFVSSLCGEETVMEYLLPSGRKVVVYTSVHGKEVATSGADAIRILALAPVGAEFRPIEKAARVFRVGKIEEIVRRMEERVTEVGRLAAKPSRCSCGSVMGLSKAGKRYCLALCWKK